MQLYDVDAEEELLASLFFLDICRYSFLEERPDLIGKALFYCREEWFSRAFHRMLFRAMKEVWKRQTEITPNLVLQAIDDQYKETVANSLRELLTNYDVRCRQRFQEKVDKKGVQMALLDNCIELDGFLKRIKTAYQARQALSPDYNTKKGVEYL